MTLSQPATGPASAEAEFGTWHRVDPRTLLLNLGPVVVAAGFYLVISASAVDTERIGLVAQALLPFLGVAAVVVRYFTGRYAIVDNALQWRVGLLARSTTQIGLDRIQDVEVTRPLLARVLGLAAVNVSSAGGSGEIKLAYLDHALAQRLGDHLQHPFGVTPPAVAAVVVDPGTAPPWQGPAPAPVVTELHRVGTGELSAWVAYRLWPAVPIGVAVVVLPLVTGAWEAWLAVLPTLPFTVIGFAKPIADRVGLTVSIDPTSLLTAEGLTTVRRTRTQRDRVQLVFARSLWLQRRRGAETVRFASADVTADSKEGSVREELALNVPAGTWQGLAAAIARRPVMSPASLRPKPQVAATATALRWAIGGSAVGMAVAAVGASVSSTATDLGGGSIAITSVITLVVVALLGVGLGVFRGRRRLVAEGWAVDPLDLLVRSGVLRRTTILLWSEKTQAIDVFSGPIQRRLGLVTVVVDIAPPGRRSRVVIRDVTVGDGDELMAALTRAGSIALPNGV